MKPKPQSNYKPGSVRDDYQTPPETRIMQKIIWTPEKRLEIIKATAAIAYQDKRPHMRKDEIMDLADRIMFLCDMPAEFLEKNKRNFEDAIKLAAKKTTINL